MFHLAPVGLSTTSKVNQLDHFLLERNIAVAVQDISESSSLHSISYNQSHPDTKVLLKSLDAFLSHGYCFVYKILV